MEKDVKRTILRVLKGKKGTGRKRTQKKFILKCKDIDK